MGISEILVQRGYNEHEAKTVAEHLLKIDKRLKPLLDNWLETAVETDLTVEDVSIAMLISRYKLLYPAALLTLDWVCREPEKAKRAIKKGIR